MISHNVSLLVFHGTKIPVRAWTKHTLKCPGAQWGISNRSFGSIWWGFCSFGWVSLDTLEPIRYLWSLDPYWTPQSLPCVVSIPEQFLWDKVWGFDGLWGHWVVDLSLDILKLVSNIKAPIMQLLGWVFSQQTNWIRTKLKYLILILWLVSATFIFYFSRSQESPVKHGRSWHACATLPSPQCL